DPMSADVAAELPPAIVRDAIGAAHVAQPRVAGLVVLTVTLGRLHRNTLDSKLDFGRVLNGARETVNRTAALAALRTSSCGRLEFFRGAGATSRARNTPSGTSRHSQDFFARPWHRATQATPAGGERVARDARTR